MRYIKTYESFSTNEEFLGGLMNKISSAFSNWKNEKLKKAGEKLAQAIEEKKDDPEMAKALADLKAAYAKLPQEDKAKIESFKDEKNIPVATEAEMKDEVMAESLILEEEGLAMKILGWLGLSVGAISFVTLIVTVIQIAIAGSGYPTSLFGLSLGTLGAVCMVTTMVFGVAGGAAYETGKES
jgi:hypothetical protein